MKNYGPNMTPKIKAELEKEIAAFDANKEKKVRAKIEREAVGKPDAAGYAKLQEAQGIDRRSGLREANPDLIAESEAVNLSKPILSGKIAKAKQLITELLSFREKQVWRLVMIQGVPIDRAADLLHLSIGSVNSYLTRARRKAYRIVKGMK